MMLEVPVSAMILSIRRNDHNVIEESTDLFGRQSQIALYCSA